MGPPLFSQCVLDFIRLVTRVVRYVDLYCSVGLHLICFSESVEARKERTLSNRMHHLENTE